MAASSLSKNVFTGTLWTGFQTIGIKVFSLLGQLILAWILVPDDFGKISILYSITGITFLVQNFGLSDVLVSRSKSFDLWLGLAQSISLTTTFACLVITLIMGLATGIIYNDQELTVLICLYSISIPFNALSAVPDAKLKIDLKFKIISLIKIFDSFATQLLTISFALFGFGVYSFIMAPIIVSIIRYIYIYRFAEIDYFFKITLIRWKYLINNSTWSFVYAFFQRIIQQFDYLILAFYVSNAILGIYYMAYSLSVQVIGVLVNSLAPVLFPSVMKIHKNDVQRIREVLLEMTKYLAMLGMPFAIWQASIAKPLVVIFFGEKWIDTVPLVQILSLGIGFSVVSSLWTIAMRFRSEFKKQALFSMASALLFLLLLLPFTILKKELGTALAVSMFHIISGPLLLYFSFQPYKIRFYEFFLPMIKYYLLSLFVFGISFGTVYLCNFNQIISIIINGIIAPILYILMLVAFDNDFKLFLNKIKLLLNPILSKSFN